MTDGKNILLDEIGVLRMISLHFILSILLPVRCCIIIIVTRILHNKLFRKNEKKITQYFSRLSNISLFAQITFSTLFYCFLESFIGLERQYKD
jgi:ABC-type iron transport system FetAB permease component